VAAPTLAPEEQAPEGLSARDCPRCGASCAELQEYCLECGQRLPLTPGVGSALATAWGRRTDWYPGDWVWPVLATFVIALLATVAVVVVRATGDGSQPEFLTATERAVAPPATAADISTLAAPPEDALRATLPELTETEPAPRQPVPRRGRLTTWPAATDGFTVVLASVPSGVRAPATERAKEASEAGLREVGVLSSSEYSSLHPGYLVVFSGIYESRGEAEAAIENARAKGYNDAYAAQVAQ
jgi:hypothetical protein